MAVAITGQITLHGITDGDLITILQVKEKTNVLGFSPQTIQPTQAQAGPAQPLEPVYNNVVLEWGTNGGIEAVLEILNQLVARRK